MTVEQLKRARYIANYVIQIQDYIKKIESTKRLTQKDRRRISKYKMQINKLLEEQEKIFDDVNKRNNCRIKTAIIMFYFKGRTWDSVAAFLNSDDTADSIRMAVKRYLDQLKGDESA